MNKKIKFIHLWNNYSGSPNVLKTIIDSLCDKGYETEIISSFNNDGFLTGVKGKHVNVAYSFENNKILRLLQFIRFQIISSIHVSKTTKDEIIYINTILPFLPAIAAKLTGKKIIYHIHESYPYRNLLHQFLFYIVKRTANYVISVSEYVKDQLDDEIQRKTFVVPNSLCDDFVNDIQSHKTLKHKKSILMVTSARSYKGIYEFCEIASQLPEFNFTLICDTTIDEIKRIFKNYLSIDNLRLISSQKNLHPYYREADLIVNFSNPQLIIETFGLSILEGMSYGLPAIVPPIGGITELVKDGVNGYKIDINNQYEIINGIKKILNDETLYEQMSKNAKLESLEYTSDKQIEKIEEILNKI